MPRMLPTRQDDAGERGPLTLDRLPRELRRSPASLDMTTELSGPRFTLQGEDGGEVLTRFDPRDGVD